MTSHIPETLGLIAGNGRLPFVFAEAARAKGVSVVTVAIREETDPALEGRVDRLGWFHVGQLSSMIEFLKSAGCREAVMAGQLRLSHLFDDWDALKADPLALDLISRIADRRGDNVLSAVVELLEAQGIRLRESTLLLEESVARAGPLTPREPTQEEEREIAFGWRMAKALAELAIGQTVVVKRRAVVAVEGVEGTDACIRRGGELGGAGIVVVKVSKPSQDLRFDLPVIGPRTVRALADARASVLAVEAGKTLILDRQEMVELAEKEGVAVVALRGPGHAE